MHYLVIDVRFPAPIHVFLEVDPRGEKGFPGFAVRGITLEPFAPPGELRKGESSGPAAAIGRDPWRCECYREFVSDRSAAAAGFVLIEPRYVGPDWAGYVRTFRPEGGKPHKKPQPAVEIGRLAR